MILFRVPIVFEAKLELFRKLWVKIGRVTLGGRKAAGTEF